MSVSKFTYHQRKIMLRERNRLRFVMEHDGIDALKAFCTQGIEQYSKALNTDYGKVYREQLCSSLIIFTSAINRGRFSEQALDINSASL